MAIIKNLFLPAVSMHSEAENWRKNGKIYSAAINNKKAARVLIVGRKRKIIRLLRFE